VLLGCADGAGHVNPMPEPASRQTQLQSRAPSAVLSIEPWTFGQSTGSIIRTQHYRVFTTSNRQIIKQVLPGFLEESLVQYQSSLADLPSPPVKLDTYLMNTRPEWATLTRALMRERAETYLRIQRGGFAASGRGVYRDLGTLSDTLNLAAHEGWHQYTQLTFRTRLPVYLEEGIATYMEGFRFDPAQPTVPIFKPWANTERYDQLRAAAGKDQLFSLGELISSSPQNLIATNQTRALTWYAQVWALVHFLREGEGGQYAAGFKDMLTDAAGGVTETTRTSRLRLMRNPLPTYFDTSIEELDAEYQAFISRITAPGARDKIVAGRSPLR
jgi:hypothetical protein